MPRSLLAALVAALAAVMPAAAWAQAGPTLDFDKPCYAEDDPMQYSGAGSPRRREVDHPVERVALAGALPARRCSPARARH